MSAKSFLPAILGVAVLGLVGCGGTATTGGVLTTPTVTSVTPNPVTHGQSITIAGANLNAGGQTTVTFTGNVTVNSFPSSITSSSLTVVVPSTIAYPSSYSVTVTTADTVGDVSGASTAVTLQVN